MCVLTIQITVYKSHQPTSASPQTGNRLSLFQMVCLKIQRLFFTIFSQESSSLISYDDDDDDDDEEVVT